MKYELETIVTVEASEISQVGVLPDQNQLAAWKEHIAEKVGSCIGETIGVENYTAKVKVQVFIHEKENDN